MDVRHLWSRLTLRNAETHRSGPLLWLLLIGGGSLALLVGAAVRLQPAKRIPLSSKSDFNATEFRDAQSSWKSQGLDDARFVNGVIQVPEDEADRYRQAWNSAAAEPSRSRWADMWQQANDRLGHFSGTRERAAARDISRAQVIARLLEELPDIETADIVWDETEATGWRTPEQARATVYLQATPGRAIGPDVVDAVRKAVAGSKAHLAPENVIVMDQSRMIAYGANDASAADIVTAQRVALFHRRLADALQHIPGLKIDIHSNPQHGTERDPVPVVVTVGIPDASIHQLAGLDATTASNPAMEPQSDRRREVFRTVERHLHQSITTKVRQLIPAGLALTAPSQLLVETVPSPATPPARTANAAPADISAWVQRNAWAVMAIVCGLGAVSMFRPRPPARGESQIGSRPSATAPPTTVASTPVATGSPRGQPDSSTRTSAARDPRPIRSPIPATATAATSHPDSDTMPIDQPSNAGTSGQRTDLLRDVLTRLELHNPSHSNSKSNGPSTATPADSPSHRLRVVSGRSGSAGLDDVEVEDFDLEQLNHLPEAELRELVADVEFDVWSRALFTASPRLRQRLLPCFPAAEAAQLDRHWQAGRPIRLREIDAAQTAIHQAWRARRQDSPVDRRVAARSALPHLPVNSPS